MDVEVNSFTYLAFNFLMLLAPMIFWKHGTVEFYKKYKAVLLSASLVAVPMLVWDIFFTYIEVWDFNDGYTLGKIPYIGLPFSEILFFFSAPIACLFIYECVIYYLGKGCINVYLQGFLMSFLVVLGCMMTIISDFGIYTVTVISLFLILVVLLDLFSDIFKRSEYWLYMLFSLFGFLLINLLLTGIPIVTYNSDMFSGFRIMSIPLEDFYYFFFMNTLVLFVYVEYLREALSEK